MEKIKILEMLDIFYPVIDGPITLVKNYSERLNKKAVCVVGVPKAGKKQKYVDKESFEVLRCRSMSAPENYRTALPNLDRKFYKEIKKRDFDIIHVHSPFTIGRYAIKLGKKLNVPVVATLHTQYKEDFKRVLHNFKPLVNFMVKYILKVYNKADSVWTVNDASCEILRSYGYKGKIEVVRNGTDFTYPENASELIDRVNKLHNLEGQKNVFVFVGRVAFYKNLVLMLNALKILKEKGEDFKMLIIGDGFDRKEYEKMVEDAGLKDNYIFTGSVKDRALLQGYYLRSDLFLFPSTFDTSSLVPIEAAAHKLPTLLIEGCCTAENIVDNENGFLAKETAESYADRIIDIINNPELKEKVGETAHKTVYRTWNDVTDEVLEKYKKLIEEKKAKENK